VIVQCLVHQHRMRIDYGGLRGRARARIRSLHPGDVPGRMYLLGHSHRYRKIIYLAVERIRTAEKLEDRFDYPRTYSPRSTPKARSASSTGPETQVELRAPLQRRHGCVSVLNERLHPDAAVYAAS